MPELSRSSILRKNDLGGVPITTFEDSGGTRPLEETQGTVELDRSRRIISATSSVVPQPLPVRVNLTDAAVATVMDFAPLRCGFVLLVPDINFLWSLNDFGGDVDAFQAAASFWFATVPFTQEAIGRTIYKGPFYAMCITGTGPTTMYRQEVILE